MKDLKHPNIVLVGHCGPDAMLLRTAVGRYLPDAPMIPVSDRKSLEKHLGPGNVLLINRVLDGDFGTGSGIELIRELVQREPAPVMLLVSNYPDAQKEAERAGAMPGFGKSGLYEDQTGPKLRSAAERAMSQLANRKPLINTSPGPMDRRES